MGVARGRAIPEAFPPFFLCVCLRAGVYIWMCTTYVCKISMAKHTPPNFKGDPGEAPNGMYRHYWKDADKLTLRVDSAGYLKYARNSSHPLRFPCTPGH